MPKRGAANQPAKPANQGAKPGRDFLVSPSAQRVEADVPRLEVPRDEDDWRYAQSFDVDDEGAAAFYRTFGFVVFRGVLDEAETEASRQDILSYVQSICPDFRADDTATWTAWKSKVFGTPNVGDSSAIWRKQLVRNRHHPRVAAGFATALGCEAPSLLCNHDRWAFYRLGERTRRNVHLDINPWEYAHEGARVRAAFAAADFRSHEALFKQNNCITRALGPHAQGTLALSDNQAEDAGFLCVPGSHAVFDEWVEALGPEPAHESGFRYDYADHSHLPKIAQRVPVREGSMIVWDARLVHGSAPDQSPAGAECRARFVQMVALRPRSMWEGTGQAQARAALVRRMLAVHGLEEPKEPLQRALLGLGDERGGGRPQQAPMAAVMDDQQAAAAAGTGDGSPSRQVRATTI